MDRISCLPDSILCCILSYIPTKEAVTTSILSRRWHHVWKDLQVFDLDYTPFLHSYHDEEWKAPFESYVNAILTHRKADSYPIEKFRLTCGVVSEEAISTWLDAVIGPRLEELYLHLTISDDDEIDEYSFTLPEGIFTCPSLMSLVLEGVIKLFDGPEVSIVYLPSLKNLELQILFVDIDELLSGCPALQNLKLDLQDSCFRIPKLQMPQTLKSLTFSELGFYYEWTEEISLREIYTPSLEYLNLSINSLGGVATQVLVINFPNMVEAHLSIAEQDENVDWVLLLLQALSETKLLALKEFTTQCIFSAPDFKFPEFHRLLNLEVDVQCFNRSFLLNLLHSCHVLQHLVVNISPFYKVELEYNGPAPPTMVPNCVTSHLKSFEYIGYEYSADEREFIAYVLQSGLVLKTVTIHLRSNLQAIKDDIVMKLSAIPRGSTMCQLNFIGQNPN
ncbi:hypothetical protein PIB30_079087 [Stylosanthes scabra]|uniref:F-box domain-containing protein n=1 Tax=Stylosanthes scabra TaxID=79078 RepID=A0ABU6WQQ4_9FABA|nr:hypothetical protein [Stylosanthes scabra]